MSDLIIRIDAKRNVCIYRHKSRQGVFMTEAEARQLEKYIAWIRLIPAKPIAVAVGEAGGIETPAEFHRRIVVNARGRIEVGSLQPDLFDVRKPESC